MSNKRSAVELLLDSTNPIDDDATYQPNYSRVWNSYQKKEDRAAGASGKAEEESSFGEWKAKQSEPLFLKTGGSLNFDKKRDIMPKRPNFVLDRPAQLSDRFGQKTTIHQQVLTRSISRKESQKFIVKSSVDSSGHRQERTRRCMGAEEIAPKKSIRFVKKSAEKYHDLEDFIKKTIGVEVLRRKKRSEQLQRQQMERKNSQETVNSNHDKPRLLRIPSRYLGRPKALESAENTVDQTPELNSFSFVNRPATKHRPSLAQQKEPLGMRLSRQMGHIRQTADSASSPLKQKRPPKQAQTLSPDNCLQRASPHKRSDSLPGKKEKKQLCIASQPTSPKKPPAVAALRVFDTSAEITGLMKKIDLIYLKMLYQQSSIAKQDDSRALGGRPALHTRHTSHGNSRTYLKNAFIGCT